MTRISELIDVPLTGADGFDSGIPVLDDWLRDASATMVRANLGRTFVWRDATGKVVAYYHLTPHEVCQEGIPSRDRFSAKHRPVPGFLLAKLALDKTLHGQRLGSALLYDALTRVATAAEQVGGRLVVVDAINDHAAGFYRAHGFKDVRADHPDRPQRLFRPIADLLG
ncbi:GNAT family N-acetyltransferase [Kitasatospora sp. MAP5-34]|uniref:GNAT family N-acetyltransferase n=1 Tax=Kitasatospora sp. MAP5-34 TaxID=3035102 RepID=UPI0024768260|nr:GNAT family N-acetyltransferase [Kitasatospora sp. MAP5-34]MDH6579853.1 putative N-acetyltransferase YhbS [Kitasatospora sp. MAP5-34]